MRRPSSFPPLWPIPPWVLALLALLVFLFFVACYILFWPRHPNVSLAGPTPQAQSTKQLAPPSTLRSTPTQAADAEAADSPLVVPTPPVEVTIPAGTVITVRTGALIDGDTAAVGSRFDGRLVSPIEVNGHTAVSQGSAVLLRLAEKKKAGFFHRSMHMKLALAGVSVNGRVYPTQAEVADIKPGDSNEGDGNPKGKKTLVVLPNTELTFKLRAPLTIAQRPDNSGSK